MAPDVSAGAFAVEAVWAAAVPADASSQAARAEAETAAFIMTRDADVVLRDAI
jgi:hypothetical protein